MRCCQHVCMYVLMLKMMLSREGKYNKKQNIVKCKIFYVQEVKKKGEKLW